MYHNKLLSLCKDIEFLIHQLKTRKSMFHINKNKEKIPINLLQVFDNLFSALNN
jgi:hypothetical protein